MLDINNLILVLESWNKLFLALGYFSILLISPFVSIFIVFLPIVLLENNYKTKLKRSINKYVKDFIEIKNG